MFVTESPLRDLLRLIVWFPLRWCVRLMSLRAALRLFEGMGDVHRLAVPGARARVDANLRRMLPQMLPRTLLRTLPRMLPGMTEVQTREAVRGYFRNHYASQLLVMVYDRLEREGVGALAEVRGAEHLRVALASGRGAVLAHGHFGPEQLALAALSLSGFDCTQVGHLSGEGLSMVGRAVALRQRRWCEERIPGRIVEASGPVLPLLRTLRAGGVVLTSGDGSGRRERIGRHVQLPFFGQPVLFPTGPARMARVAGAALLPVFVTRGETAPYAVVVEPPIDTGDILAATREFVVRYERRVAENPAFMRFLDVFDPGGIIEP